MRTLPTKVKLKTHKAVASRWTVLPSLASNRPRFLRVRVGRESCCDGHTDRHTGPGRPESRHHEATA
jgi:hypothetical protein